MAASRSLYFRITALVDRHRKMEIGAHMAVPGKMLAHARHALAQAVIRLAASCAIRRGRSGKRGRRSRRSPGIHASTGVKLKSTPQARSSPASHNARCRAPPRTPRRGRGPGFAQAPHRVCVKNLRESAAPGAFMVDRDQQLGFAQVADRRVSSHNCCGEWKLRENKMTPPTKGGATFPVRRLNCAPAISSITGPKPSYPRSSFMVYALQHHEGAGHLDFVAQAQMRPADARF